MTAQRHNRFVFSVVVVKFAVNRELKQTDAATERRRSHSNFLSIIE